MSSSDLSPFHRRVFVHTDVSRDVDRLAQHRLPSQLHAFGGCLRLGSSRLWAIEDRSEK
jgi:hypothetical protein